MGCSFNYVLLWLWFVIRGLFVTTAIPEAKSSLYYGFHSTIPHVVDAVKINKSVDDKKRDRVFLSYLSNHGKLSGDIVKPWKRRSIIDWL